MITFSSETKFVLPNKKLIRDWLNFILNFYSKTSDNFFFSHKINYVFCDDAYLLLINQKYLGHDYYTDIITFDFSEKNTLIADIYISIERVKENAKKLNENFDKELKRVIVHGILHLVGYCDKTLEEKKNMRKKEDFYIDLFPIKQK